MKVKVSKLKLFASFIILYGLEIVQFYKYIIDSNIQVVRFSSINFWIGLFVSGLPALFAFLVLFTIAVPRVIEITETYLSYKIGFNKTGKKIFFKEVTNYSKNFWDVKFFTPKGNKRLNWFWLPNSGKSKLFQIIEKNCITHHSTGRGKALRP